MNETDSSNKSLAVPAEIDLNGGTLPAVFWTAGDRLYPRLERSGFLPPINWGVSARRRL